MYVCSGCVIPKEITVATWLFSFVVTTRHEMTPKNELIWWVLLWYNNYFFKRYHLFVAPAPKPWPLRLPRPQEQLDLRAGELNQEVGPQLKLPPIRVPKSLVKLKPNGVRVWIHVRWSSGLAALGVIHRGSTHFEGDQRGWNFPGPPNKWPPRTSNWSILCWRSFCNCRGFYRGWLVVFLRRPFLAIR